MGRSSHSHKKRSHRKHSEIQNKLMKYAKNGRLSKMKKVLGKDETLLKMLPTFFNKRSENLLHVAAKNGHDYLIKFLISHKVGVLQKDNNGNTPAHLALEHCLLSGCFSSAADLVDPMLVENPSLLFLTNDQNETPASLLSDIRLAQQELRDLRDEAFPSDYDARNNGEFSDAEWREKLAEEYEEQWGRYEEDDDFAYSSHETYDNWCNRISRERHQQYSRPSSSTPPSTDPTKSKLETDDTAMRQRFEEAMRQRGQVDRYHLWKRRWSEFIVAAVSTTEGELTSDSVPWPPFLTQERLDVVDFVQGDKRAELKSLRIVWHPDRFTQKFSHRGVGKEVMVKVNKVSQMINEGLNSLK